MQHNSATRYITRIYTTTVSVGVPLRLLRRRPSELPPLPPSLELFSRAASSFPPLPWPCLWPPLFAFGHTSSTLPTQPRKILQRTNWWSSTWRRFLRTGQTKCFSFERPTLTFQNKPQSANRASCSHADQQRISCARRLVPRIGLPFALEVESIFPSHLRGLSTCRIVCSAGHRICRFGRVSKGGPHLSSLGLWEIMLGPSSLRSRVGFACWRYICLPCVVGHFLKNRLVQ
jgi:hypothetical protein